jgi:hypothetical protein
MKVRSHLNIRSHYRSFQRFAVTRPFLVCIVGTALVSGVMPGQDAGNSKKASQPKEPIITTASSTAQLEAAVTAARERAKLLHDIYSTTLDAIHHHYFRREGAVIPARAMEDVFREMAGLSGTMANWISVNTKAMSIDHKPMTDFEKTAVEEITAGKEAYELVGKHFYRRAARIPLGTNCIGCHDGMLSSSNKLPRWAGLVISIPLNLEKK